tara:strand:+ start:924 stop:1253 length:330 start_codon:yes stop_codon:yes gene_type:complete
MIDTDKYEGHEKKLRLDEGTHLQIVVPPNRPVGVWNKWEGGLLFDLGEKAAMGNTCIPTARLMADAPLLLAEVKRLHSEIEHLNMMFCVRCGACGTETEYAECTCTEDE